MNGRDFNTNMIIFIIIIAINSIILIPQKIKSKLIIQVLIKIFLNKKTNIKNASQNYLLSLKLYHKLLNKINLIFITKNSYYILNYIHVFLYLKSNNLSIIIQVLFIKECNQKLQIDFFLILNKSILTLQSLNKCKLSNCLLIVNFNVVILLMHLKSSQFIYDLYIRVDTNTKGHRQWFYFSVKNKKPIKVTFNIYRFNKSLSLYQRGMKPYVLSKKQIQLNQKVDWQQAGSNVKYTLQNVQSKKKRYILSFDFQFKYQFDEVYFAACPPYSYTFLNQQLNFYKSKLPNHFQIQKFTTSLCGLDIPLITIKNHHFQNKNIKHIIIIGRSHPGQSSSSWVIDGIIQFLVSEEAQYLNSLKNIVFKIVPMMNPDGVFMGNYRTGIVGMDLNRNFNTGKQIYFPEIWALKNLIHKLKQKGQVDVFIDVHGHSILKNSFIFGPNLDNYSDNRLSIFPQKLRKFSRLFRYESCRFKNEKQKIQTARVYCQFKERILSYTIQNSLGLYFNNFKTQGTKIEVWRHFGRNIIQTINEIYENEQDWKPMIKMNEQIKNKIQKKYIVQQKITKQNQILQNKVQKVGKIEQVKKLQKQQQIKIKQRKQRILPIRKRIEMSKQIRRSKNFDKKDGVIKYNNQQLKKTLKYTPHAFNVYQSKQKVFIQLINTHTKQQIINNANIYNNNSNHYFKINHKNSSNFQNNCQKQIKSDKKQAQQQLQILQNVDQQLENILQQEANDLDSSSQDLQQQQLRPILMIVQNINRIQKYLQISQNKQKISQIQPNTNNNDTDKVFKLDQLNKTIQKNTQDQTNSIPITVTHGFKQIKLNLKKQQIKNITLSRNRQKRNSDKQSNLNLHLTYPKQQHFTQNISQDQSFKFQTKYTRQANRSFNKQFTKQLINYNKQLGSIYLQNYSNPIPQTNSKTFNLSINNSHASQTKTTKSIKSSRRISNKGSNYINEGANLQMQINSQMADQIQKRIQELKQKKLIFNEKKIFEELKSSQSKRNSITNFYHKKKL